MEITEVRIKLMEDSDDRLQAFCSITFDDCFVVRDLKIIEGTNGPFVAMPSRKLTFHCPQCGSKNHLRSSYCNQRGARLKEDRLPRDSDGRTKLYADIAHPINSTCREMIQDRVISEFNSELQRAEQPGYVSKYDEDYLEELDDPSEPNEPPSDRQEARPERPRAEVQPAEREPRPPHHIKNHPARTTRHSHLTADRAAAAERERSDRPEADPERHRDSPHDSGADDFGAGIFDD